jgi:hypothetical protein
MQSVKLKCIMISDNARPVFNQRFIDVTTNPQFKLELIGNWVSVKLGYSDPRFVPVNNISWMGPLNSADMGVKETPKKGRKPKIKAVADEQQQQAV